MAIYACGVLAGLSAAYLIFTATFGKQSPLAAVSVKIWGFRGPLGAFICAWGGLAMLVSAPFDDWWHNAYGLDVKIISPPHMVLAAGFFGINFGAIMLMLAFLNRASGASRAGLQRMFLYVGSMAVCESLLLKLEYISRPEMHGSLFYLIVILGTLGIIVALGVASRHPWGCTIVTAVYTIFGVAFLWILPLFPGAAEARPRLYAGDPLHPVGVSAAGHRPRVRDRLILATTAGLQAGRARAGDRHGVLCDVPCRPVAVRELPDVTVGAELVLRDDLSRLRHPGDLAVRPVRIRASGTD